MVKKGTVLAICVLTFPLYANEYRVSLNTHPYSLTIGHAKSFEIGASIGMVPSASEIEITYGYAGIHNSSGDLAIADPENIGDIDIGVLQYANLGFYKNFGVLRRLLIGVEVGYNSYSKVWRGQNEELEGLLQDKKYLTMGPEIQGRVSVFRSIEAKCKGGIKIDPLDFGHNFPPHALFFPNLMIDVSVGLGFKF